MTKENFWKWFEENMAAIELFIVKEPRDYSIYQALSENLRQYNKFLIPEITIDEDNHFVLIISCDGIRQGIPYAEKLTEDMKPYPNWKIIKYRQPGPMEVIPVNGLNLKRKDVFLLWQKTLTNTYLLTFYVKGYSSNNPAYEIGTLLHLDHTIGEFNSMTRIENAKLERLRFFQSKRGLKTLDDLKIELDSNP